MKQEVKQWERLVDGEGETLQAVNFLLDINCLKEETRKHLFPVFYMNFHIDISDFKYFL